MATEIARQPYKLACNPRRSSHWKSNLRCIGSGGGVEVAHQHRFTHIAPQKLQWRYAGDAPDYISGSDGIPSSIIQPRGIQPIMIVHTYLSKITLVVVLSSSIHPPPTSTTICIHLDNMNCYDLKQWFFFYWVASRPFASSYSYSTPLPIPSHWWVYYSWLMVSSMGALSTVNGNLIRTCTLRNYGTGRVIGRLIGDGKCTENRRYQYWSTRAVVLLTIIINI